MSREEANRRNVPPMNASTGAATKPWRALEAERVLDGATADEQTLQAAAEAAMKGATPHRHNAFKIELAKRAIVRALKNAIQSTGEKQS